LYVRDFLNFCLLVPALILYSPSFGYSRTWYPVWSPVLGNLRRSHNLHALPGSPMLLLLLCAFLAAASVSNAVQIVATGKTGANSGFCLSATGCGNTDPVVIQPCSTNSLQQWHIDPFGIWNEGCGNCIDLRDGVVADNTVVQTYACLGSQSFPYTHSANQGWAILDGYIFFDPVKVTSTSHCITIKNADFVAGQPVLLYTCPLGSENYGEATQYNSVFKFY
jgi:hypothetical protein